MLTKRTLVNLMAFGIFAALLVWAGLTQYVMSGASGRMLTVQFTDATGVAPRNDVTMRGVPIGVVTDVALARDGLVEVKVQLDPGESVPRGTKAALTRRSAIGDITMELTPGTGAALPSGAMIPVADTSTPPDPEKTIEILARVLHAVPSSQLSTLVAELAATVRGRGSDLASLSVNSADLPQRILQVQSRLEDLISKGPQVTGVLADNASTLADDIAQTAALADILRDRRHDLVSLSKNGAAFADVANLLIAEDKANLACMIADYGGINARLATAQNLANLKDVLELNHYFFDGVWILVRQGRDGLDWFRVQLLPPQQPSGKEYPSRRSPPNVFGADSCRSIYGKGVGPGSQPGGLYLAPGSDYVPGH